MTAQSSKGHPTRAAQKAPRHLFSHPLTWLLLGSVAVAGACGGASTATPADSIYGSGSSGGDGGGATSGLPCDVVAVLQNGCLDCHGSPLSGSAPISLLSYDDLTAPSAVDPTMMVVERSVVRMQDSASPMPPGAGVSAPAADVAVLQAWIAAGTPMGDCGSIDPGPDPFDVPVECTSGLTYNQGDDGEDAMYPGQACIKCHRENSGGEGPLFAFAGTVYPTGHEPDNCISTGFAGAVIEVTDANNKVVTRPVGANGNFSYTSSTFKTPYTARVLFEGKERVMHTPQTDGDCNLCHTQDGTQDAPGRILLP